MYESFYGFNKKPFSLTFDPELLYMGQTHSTALSMLEYGVLSQSGFTVITGEVGSGKTTIVRHMLEQLHDGVRIGLITNTHANMGQLLPWVMHAFGQEYRDENPVAQYEGFTQFLQKQFDSKERTVLIVDEAQNLGLGLLEELRMLSNLNTITEQCLQIILVGQPQLRDLLMKPELMQFSQRVVADYHIAALSPKETVAYIKHRLVMAGATEDVFTPHAYMLIHAASRGVPRLINVLCDTALSFSFADELRIVNEDYLRGVLKERAEGGLLALGQTPLRQFGENAYDAPDLDNLLGSVLNSDESPDSKQ
ncbi:ExeA family protein [Agarilytica rhodophyticola]|uniref:ExeA family protein n=1 Tax=Agarilytica rhodophyticola TaxID=1737490 RepID=UPI000B346823|nr:AAA family ATPase [Agarilytica rhodophyticola]